MIWSVAKLPETKPTYIKRPNLSQIIKLAKMMFSSASLWGHILLIGATNSILFCFYEEAPFVFIQQLGMRPRLYGFLGVVIAFAAIVAARISFRLSGLVEKETLILSGALLSIIGGIGLFLTQALGLF